MKHIPLFFVVFLFYTYTHAQLTCDGLFEDSAVAGHSVVGTKLNDVLLGLQNSEAGKAFKDSALDPKVLSADQLFVINRNLKRLDKKIRSYEWWLDFYKGRMGTSMNRIKINAQKYASKMKFKLRLGLVDQVKSEVAVLVKRYEVDFLMAQYYSRKILSVDVALKAKNLGLAQTWRLKRERARFEKQLDIYNVYVGSRHDEYIELKKMMEAEALHPQFGANAKGLLIALEKISKGQALRYLIPYQKISVEVAEKYVEANVVAHSESLAKTVSSETLLYLKMATFSGPALDLFRSVIYKLPLHMSLFGISIPVREYASDLLGVGYESHLKDLYLEPMLEVMEISDPADKYKSLKSLNASTDNNGLLVAMSVFVEADADWTTIRDYAHRLVQHNPAEKPFYDLMMKADQDADKLRAASLFYQKSKITTSVKSAFLLFSIYQIYGKFIDVSGAVAPLQKDGSSLIQNTTGAGVDGLHRSIQLIQNIGIPGLTN